MLSGEQASNNVDDKSIKSIIVMGGSNSRNSDKDPDTPDKEAGIPINSTLSIDKANLLVPLPKLE